VPIVSERYISVFISLLASKIKELRQELSITETTINLLDDEALDDRADLQDVLNEYENMLGELKIIKPSSLTDLKIKFSLTAKPLLLPYPRMYVRRLSLKFSRVKLDSLEARLRPVKQLDKQPP
jgi:hypothetical protein